MLMIEALGVLLGKELKEHEIQIRFLGGNKIEIVTNKLPTTLQSVQTIQRMTLDGTSSLLDAVREVTGMYVPDEETSFAEFCDEHPDDLVIDSHILTKLRTLEDLLPEYEICT